MKRSLSQNALEIFKKARNDNLFCDAVLKTEDGGQFSVHKCILMTCSSYFNTLFVNTTYGDTENSFLIPGIAKNVLGAVIDYAYVHKMKLDFCQIKDILSAADQLNILSLVNDCSRFLMENINAENCIGVQELAEEFCLAELNVSSHQYTRSHFMEVAEKSQELMKVSAPELASILTSDELNVKKEEMVWEAIIRWIQVDEEARKSHIGDLIKCVRLGLVNIDYFMDEIQNHRYVLGNEECQPLIIEATIFFCQDGSPRENSNEFRLSDIARPRISNEVIFGLGGWNNRPTNCIETYDIRADRWVITNEDFFLDQPRAYHGCVVVNNEIYVIGGYNGNVYFSSCRCFNVVTKRWKDIGPMHNKRSYVSVAVVDDVIYAMGGCDGNSRLNTAEMYKSFNNQWTMIVPMNFQRSGASAATLHGCVYITGGFTGTEFLQSVEYYSPSSNQWTMVAPMRNRRSGLCCLNYKNQLYVLGGFNGRERMQSVEKYNARDGRWKYVPNMLKRRTNFAAAVVEEDKILAVGGYDGSNVIREVEYYSEELNQWCKAADMNVCRFGLEVCVVGDIPNIGDYVCKKRHELAREGITESNGR